MECLRSEVGEALVLEGQLEFVGKHNLLYQLQQLKNKCNMEESGNLFENSGADIEAMKEALNAQQKLLCKLYEEVDQEREASEIAASEALAMILRLQVEKAAVETEAKQYKRIAEEKMFHANECLMVLEDVVYQKEMEIAALECQIQAFKFKILSLGCYDYDCGEEVNMNAWTDNGVFLEGTKHIAVDQELKVESDDTYDTGSSYWQQIKKLDERVKGITSRTEFGRNNRCSSMGALSSRRSINALSSWRDAVKRQPEILQETKTIDDYVHSTSVQDIFEVPEVSARHIDIAGKGKKEPDEKFAGGKIRLPELDSPAVNNSLFKLKTKKSFDSSLEDRLFKSSGRKNLDHFNFKCAPSSAISNAELRSEIQQLSKRMELLEQAANGINSRPEINVVREEELGSVKELLNAVHEQLSTIKTDINSLKTSKSKKRDDSVFTRIQEDMLHFWL